MTTTSPHPEQGQMVSVRSRNWMVTDVSASTLPTERSANRPGVAPASSHAVVRRRRRAGRRTQVIWEIEPGAKVVEKVALPDPTGFDPPDQLDAFLDAVRWGAASSADVRNIQSPFRSGIEIEDYQLDPVVRAIQMPQGQPADRRRRGPGQDHRSGHGGARTHHPPPGPKDSDRLPGRPCRSSGGSRCGTSSASTSASWIPA